MTPEVENYSHSGAISRFTAKPDLTDSAGVYELIDDSGFVVFLYGAETFKFFKGKQLLFRVISTEGARPHVMLYDKDYRNTGTTAVRVKEEHKVIGANVMFLIYIARTVR